MKATNGCVYVCETTKKKRLTKGKKVSIKVSVKESRRGTDRICQVVKKY